MISSSLFLPAPVTRSSHSLIFFISGNPGLISYYTDYLSMLSSMIHDESSHTSSTSYDICGYDLLGFRDGDHTPFGVNGSEPWDLEGQIEDVYQKVMMQSQNEGNKRYDSVILMGHSVGAYIAVEILSRYRQRDAPKEAINFSNAILLFPTLTHIALSPQGKRLTALQNVPWLGSRAHTLAKLALLPFTVAVLSWVIEKVLGFSPQAASITADWLKSRDGIHQALHLGRSEMHTIHEDTWEDGLWELTSESKPRFYLFYGQNDHWVANKMRDEFVEKRKSGAKVAIDEGDVPHAFCTRERDSWFIAKKVSEWIQEMGAA